MFINLSKAAHRRNAIFALLFCSVLMASSILLVPETMPSPSSAEAGVVPTPSLTVNGSHLLSIYLDPGQFGTSNTVNLIVETTNYTGYTMTIAPSSGNSTDLVNSADSNVTLPTITADTITSSNFSSLSTAAYALSTDNGTNYKKVTNGGQLYATNGATTSSTGALTLKLGAKSIASTPSGAYTKTFTLTTLANDTTYNITYDKNTEDTVSNLPDPASGTMSGTSFTLSGTTPSRTNFRFVEWNTQPDGNGTSYAPSSTYVLDPETQNSVTFYAIWGCSKICYHGNGADAGEMPDQKISGTGGATSTTTGGGLRASNFSRAGYGFAGWSEDKDAYTHLTDNDQENDPTIFGPSQTITAAQAGNGLDLYAVWVPAAKDGNNNPIYLQGWTGCSTLKDREVIALTDSRDGSVYAVTKIKKVENDVTTYEKCWMIENLRLDVATVTINSTNTNHPTTAFRQEATSLSSAFWDTCNSYTSTCVDHISYSLANIDRNNTASYNTDDRTSSWYSYGGMYNWYTATAGNGTYSKETGNVDGSICPSGWSLPTGGSSGDFSKLDIALGGTGGQQSTAIAASRWHAYPINIVRSGEYYDSRTSSRGNTGYYWSGTGAGSYYSYYLQFTISSVVPVTVSSYRYYGDAIRCLAGSMTDFTITYDANGGDASSVPDPQTSATQGNGIYTFTLSNTVPTYSGDGNFSFAGWIDEEGNEASAGGTYTAHNTSTTLYARWANDDCNSTATTIDTGNSTTDAVCLQDINGTVKSAMVSKQTYTLKDARDNKEYTVAKLDDGNVWMTKNLNYGKTSDIVLTSHDTDLPSYLTFKAPASTTAFETMNSAATSPKILIDDAYGGYYSYAAAIASTTPYLTSGQNITTSICPAGWDLPTNAQYNTLKSSAGLTSYAKAHAAPYNFSYAGYKNGTSSPTSRTSIVRLWTSANYAETTAYYATGYSNASSGDYKRYGESVRCIASNGSASIKYYKNDGTSDFVMQNNVDINSDKLYSSSTFSRGDTYAFKRWNTTSAGDGTNYAFNANISTTSATDGQTLELYAVWNPILKVVYHANYEGNTNTFVQWIEAGTTGTLEAYNRFTRSGYKIARWDTDPDGEGTPYATSSSYTAPANTQAGDELHLYAVWELPNTVIYDANGGRCETSGTVTDTCMQNVKHTNVVTGDVFDLFASNYSRSGYGFVGWSTNPSAQPGGASTIYGPNEAITATSDFIATKDANRNITLYAIWVASSGNLQNFSCSSLTNIGDVTALTDTRDNQVYAVAKLKDGNCWMIENLRLEAANSRGADNIAKSQGYASGFTGLADAETEHFTDGDTTSNSLYSISVETGKSQITGSNSAHYSSLFPRYNNTNTSSRASSPSATGDVTSKNSHTDLNAVIYSYGNYYTWAAAVADIAYGYGPDEVVASTSICPTGWHIPYGSNGTGVYGGKTSGGFSYLDTQLESPDGSHGTGDNQIAAKASQRWRTYPNNFLYSGRYSDSGAIDYGSSGSYWSSTPGSITGANELSFGTIVTSPGRSNVGREQGFAVRCVVSNYYNLTVSYGTGIASILVDGNPVSDGQSVALMEATSHTINMTFDSGYGFDSWSVSNATIGSTSTQSTTLVMENRNAILTANGKLAPHTVIYNANGGDCGNNTTTCMQRVKHTNVEIGDTFDLFASNYSRSGYGFVGWSTNPNAQPGGSSTIYGPNETVIATSDLTAVADADRNITLYAIWVASSGNIQNFNCSSLANIGDITALTDTRDSQTYAVAKLKDGNCWMIENLRLNNTASHNSDGSLAQGYAQGFVGLADPETADFSDSTTANTLYSTANITGVYLSSSFPRYNNANTSSRATNPSATNNVTSNSSHTNLNANIYSYGNYYTWAAAAADIRGNNYGPGDVAASTSICPAGWHLPYGSNGTGTYGGKTPGGFSYLDTQLESPDGSHGTGSQQISAEASRRWTTYPNNFLYSGGYSDSSVSHRGSYGNYWGSTTLSVIGATELIFTGTTVNPGTTNTFRYQGYAVRCVVEPPMHTLTISFGTGVAGVEIDGTSYNNGDTVSLAQGSTHTIEMTFDTGYGFDSWAVSGTGTTIASTTTNPATITIGSAAATLTATAKLGPISFDDAYASGGKSKQGSYYTMQDMNTNICSAVTTGQTSSLIDTRDNTVYTVAKLTDDQCWMTKNMRLDFSNSTLTSKTVAQLESMTNNPMTGFFSDAISTGYATASTDFDTDHFFVVKYNKSNIGNTTTDSTGHTYDEYGVYYNWYTATAGRDTQNGLSSGDAAGDICPTGWHLPKGTNSGEFFALNTAINSGSTSSPSGLLASPASFLYSGYYYNSTAYGRDSEGCYWSSTVYNVGQQADVLCFDSSSVYPGTDYYGMHSGFAVRCVSDAAASNNSNNNSNNNNSQQNSQQQQNAEPQATPSAMPSVQSMSLSAPTNTESTDAEDQTEGMEDSEATSTAPLGVRRSSTEGDSSASGGGTVVKPGAVSDSDIFGTIAVVSAGVVAITGALILADKKNKEDEEDETKN